MKIIRSAAALLLAVLTMLTVLTACDGGADDKPDNGEQTIPTPLFDSYSAYVDAKTDIFGAFTTRVYAAKDLALSAGAGLLSLSSVDIAFLPLSLLQSAEKEGGLFEGNAKGYYSCRASAAGGSFDLVYTTYKDAQQEIKGSFDPETGTLYAEKFESGVITYSMEYVKDGGGYTAQYVTFGGDESEVTRIKFSESSCMVCTFSGKAPERIAQIPEGEFAKSGAVTVIEENGELTLITEEEGED